MIPAVLLRTRPIVASILCLCLMYAAQLEACTTFVLRSESQLLYGRSLDWLSGVGMVVVNKRDVARTALISPPGPPARWVSRYGSVTFNQVGRGLPYGGMNEVGLVVENMWLEETEYPEAAGRPPDAARGPSVAAGQGGSTGAERIRLRPASVDRHH